ncbi:MAG: hypothetical protein ACXWBP_03280 [Limisphaerales bacterium]
MRRTIQTVFVLATCWLFVSCATNKVQKELARVFVEMEDAGKLPGLPPGEGGDIHMQTSEMFDRITYPCTRNIFVMRGDDPSCYTYHFVKSSKQSEWHLTKAWVTDRDGQRSELKVH